MLKKNAAGYVLCGLMLGATAAQAEGIIDIKPSIGANISYDDNVFRFSSPSQAEQAFGSKATSDLVKRLDLGLDADIRLSRQLLRLSTSLSESRYNRFDLLDNTAKSYGLAWDWQLGDDWYGVISTRKSESIAGFTEIRNPVKNIRTVDKQAASLNWRFHPDWTTYVSHEQLTTENELIGFEALDREDAITETGVRYRNLLGTQLGLSYRKVDSQYPNRTGFAAFLFGDESLQSAVTLDAAWLPSAKARISARLSRVTIDYDDSPQREFSGISQRWDVAYALTSKVTLNATAYREVSPIDDILSTYVEATGASFNPSWAISNKVVLRGGVGYEDREYLGSSGIVNTGFIVGADDRSDSSRTANLSLVYLPSLKTVFQMQYQAEKRESTLGNQSFRFNNLSFVARYQF